MLIPDFLFIPFMDSVNPKGRNNERTPPTGLQNYIRKKAAQVHSDPL